MSLEQKREAHLRRLLPGASCLGEFALLGVGFDDDVFEVVGDGGEVGGSNPH
jgi:hypothetical protein